MRFRGGGNPPVSKNIPQKIQGHSLNSSPRRLNGKNFFLESSKPKTDKEILELRETLEKTHNFASVDTFLLAKLHSYLDKLSKFHMHNRQYVFARSDIFLQEEVEAELLLRIAEENFLMEEKEIKSKFNQKVKNKNDQRFVNPILYEFDLETEKILSEIEEKYNQSLQFLENNFKSSRKSDPFTRLNKKFLKNEYEMGKNAILNKCQNEKRFFIEKRQQERKLIERRANSGSQMIKIQKQNQKKNTQKTNKPKKLPFLLDSDYSLDSPRNSNQIKNVKIPSSNSNSLQKTQNQNSTGKNHNYECTYRYENDYSDQSDTNSNISNKNKHKRRSVITANNVKNEKQQGYEEIENSKTSQTNFGNYLETRKSVAVNCAFEENEENKELLPVTDTSPSKMVESQKKYQNSLLLEEKECQTEFYENEINDHLNHARNENNKFENDENNCNKRENDSSSMEENDAFIAHSDNENVDFQTEEKLEDESSSGNSKLNNATHNGKLSENSGSDSNSNSGCDSNSDSVSRSKSKAEIFQKSNEKGNISSHHKKDSLNSNKSFPDQSKNEENKDDSDDVFNKITSRNRSRDFSIELSYVATSDSELIENYKNEESDILRRALLNELEGSDNSENHNRKIKSNQKIQNKEEIHENSNPELNTFGNFDEKSSSKFEEGKSGIESSSSKRSFSSGYSIDFSEIEKIKNVESDALKYCVKEENDLIEYSGSLCSTFSPRVLELAEVNDFNQTENSHMSNVEASNQESTQEVPTKEELTQEETTKKEHTKEEPTKEESTKEESTKEEPTKEEPAKEEPTKEESTKEEHTKEESTKEEPTKEESTKEESTKEEPTKEEQTKEESTKEEPTKEESTKEESTKEESTKEESTKEESTKEESTKEEQTKEESTKEESTKEEPTKEEELNFESESECFVRSFQVKLLEIDSIDDSEASEAVSLEGKGSREVTFFFEENA